MAERDAGSGVASGATMKARTPTAAQRVALSDLMTFGPMETSAYAYPSKWLSGSCAAALIRRGWARWVDFAHVEITDEGRAAALRRAKGRA